MEMEKIDDKETEHICGTMPYHYQLVERNIDNYVDNRKNIEPMNISSAISIHEEDVARVAGKLTESGMEVDTMKLPTALMQFAEYYMAIKGLINDPNIKLIIFDRMPSIDIPHLMGNSIDFFESNESILLGMNTPYGLVSMIDIELCRMLHSNVTLKIPPPRSQLLKYCAIDWLIEKWDLDKEIGDKISYDEFL